MKMENPIVMIIRLMTDARLAVRIANRYINAPIIAVVKTEISSDSGIERPADAASVYESMPPIITNSPWAKFMILVTA